MLIECHPIAQQARGRPPAFDPAVYKGRNVVERSYNDHKQWRDLATRHDKFAAVYRGGWSYARARSGFANKETLPRATTGKTKCGPY